MKGLLLNSTGKKVEALEFVKLGLRNNITSYTCNYFIPTLAVLLLTFFFAQVGMFMVSFTNRIEITLKQ